jgi:hypothetical protein
MRGSARERPSVEDSNRGRVREMGGKGWSEGESEGEEEIGESGDVPPCYTAYHYRGCQCHCSPPNQEVGIVPKRREYLPHLTLPVLVQPHSLTRSSRVSLRESQRPYTEFAREIKRLLSFSCLCSFCSHIFFFFTFFLFFLFFSFFRYIRLFFVMLLLLSDPDSLPTSCPLSFSQYLFSIYRLTFAF